MIQLMLQYQDKQPKQALIHNHTVGSAVEPSPRRNIMAANIDDGLHHHKPHHAERRAAREQVDENKQRQNDFRPVAEQQNQREKRVDDLQIIARRLGNAGQDLEMRTQGRRQEAEKPFGKFRHGGGPIIAEQDGDKGQEMVTGTVSNLQGLGTIAAGDQQSLDDLERQRALIRKQQEVQSAKTGLARETARTDSAKTKVDLELDSRRSVNQAIKDGAKNPPTIVIK